MSAAAQPTAGVHLDRLLCSDNRHSTAHRQRRLWIAHQSFREALLLNPLAFATVPGFAQAIFARSPRSRQLGQTPCARRAAPT